MNGPQHYTEAQRCLANAKDWAKLEHYPFPATGLSVDAKLALRMADIAEAQVHATLALAAATITAGSTVTRAWAQAMDVDSPLAKALEGQQ